MILVTGGSGYVGSKLVPMLAQRAPVRVLETMNFGNPIEGLPNVEFMQGDIRAFGDVRRAMEGVDAVVHLAGIVTDELVDMNHDYSNEVNVVAMLGLCEAAVAAGAKRFIYASSSSVYGSQPHVCDESTPPQPQTAYAFQKLAGEQILNKFKDNLWCFSVRCATCCGPAPRMRLDTIVNTFCAQAYFKGRITVWGGQQHRSNIHVEDVGWLYKSLALDSLVNLPSGGMVNAVRGHHTAEELAYMIADIIPSQVAVDSAKVDTRNYRMKSDMWRPAKSIQDAIKDNLAWFKAGNIKDVDDSIFYNTRRMAGVMERG